jgi:hypothetical protein
VKLFSPRRILSRSQTYRKLPPHPFRIFHKARHRSAGRFLLPASTLQESEAAAGNQQGSR